MKGIAKVGSQDIPGITGKFGLGEQNEAGQMFTEFCHENALECLVNNTREKFTHGYHQIINTEIKLVIFFVAKDGEPVHSQQKQDLDLTVDQIISFS